MRVIVVESLCGPEQVFEDKRRHETKEPEIEDEVVEAIDDEGVETELGDPGLILQDYFEYPRRD